MSLRVPLQTKLFHSPSCSPYRQRSSTVPLGPLTDNALQQSLRVSLQTMLCNSPSGSPYRQRHPTVPPGPPTDNALKQSLRVHSQIKLFHIPAGPLTDHAVQQSLRVPLKTTLSQSIPGPDWPTPFNVSHWRAAHGALLAVRPSQQQPALLERNIYAVCWQEHQVCFHLIRLCKWALGPTHPLSNEYRDFF
jgi:hypothetical protein